MAQSPLPLRRGRRGVPVLGFLAGATLCRRDAVLAVGGFEQRLFLGGEEWLVVDLAAAGWTLAYAEDVIVHHYPAPVRPSSGRSALLARNLVWLAWLRRPPRAALAATRRILTQANGERGAILLGVLRGLPWVLARRRRLPLHVERSLELLEMQDG